MARSAATLDPTRLAGIERTCAYYNVRKATRLLADVYDRELRPLGLHGTQFTLLVAVALLDGGTVGRLADAIGADRTTLSRTLAPLERDALIASHPGEDRRERRLRLTPRGEDVLQRAIPAWERTQAAIVEALGEDAWRGLLEGARRVHALAAAGWNEGRDGA